jgi:monomeric sarcosine oxidase
MTPSTGPYEVAVIGLGAAGAATLRALARAGVRAIGLDRWAPPHPMGSSHGETRLLRVAYGEGAGYTPMMQRAVGLWRELEADTGRRLLEQTGVVYAGPASSAFLQATLAAAEAWDVPIEPPRDGALPAALPSDWLAFVEPGAGFLHAEPAIEALLDDARAHGAEILPNRPCLGLSIEAEGAAVATADGVLTARKVVVAAGAWTAALLPEVAPVLGVERRTLHWFADPSGRHAHAAGFRPFFIEDEQGRALYGFPDLGAGVKIAEHRQADLAASPDAVERSVRPEETAALAAQAARWFPDLGRPMGETVCLYPMSADEHFILDRLPGRPHAAVLAGLSGHGFKFAPVLGEAAADLVLGRTPRIDLEPFRLGRFGS